MRRRICIAICMVLMVCGGVLLQGCECEQEKGMSEESILEESDRADAGESSKSEKQDSGREPDRADAGENSKNEKQDSGEQDKNQSVDAQAEREQGDMMNGSRTEGAERQEAAGLAVPSVAGALHVEGTQLTDSHGNAVQLKGISTHGIAWFPGYINTECFGQLRQEWNVNVIRLAMYTAEENGYCSGGNQEEQRRLVKEGVRCATENDTYVIIDWHILSDSNPNMHIEEAKAFFAEMSAEFAGYNNVLYEICNEPNGGTDWKTIKAYAEEVIPVIRENAAESIIIVGTPNWSQYVDQAAAEPIEGYDNLMYTLHFYAATHKEELRNTMVSAVEAGLPVFVTEYGICDASGNGVLDIGQAELWVSTMNEYGISYAAWNLSNKNESSAILLPDCQKTSGFTEADLTESGKWLYRMLTQE